MRMRVEQARSFLNKKRKDAIKILTGEKCENCAVEHKMSVLSLHHIIPVSEHVDEKDPKFLKSNPNVPENLIVLCRNCHALADEQQISREMQTLKVGCRSPEVLAEMKVILAIPTPIREIGVNTSEFYYVWSSLNYYKFLGHRPYRNNFSVHLGRA